jgi:putative transcriptional regulator
MPVPDLKGRLLVAAPGLFDANFDRTVVLLVEHTDEGALGVILNRPSDTALSEALPDWGPLAASPPVVFEGGPVVPGGAIALGRVRGGDDDVEGWTPVLGRVGLVDLGREAALMSADLEAVRVFVGHAGWGPGQLEAEVAAGGWFVVDADPLDPLHAQPDRLWNTVLGRQRGRMAWFANCPPDPSTN